ncbi:hypothetical protein AA13595_2542 [Gluconacetobacter johannae DSM 13595]|uniref:Nucleoside phosphorylase domain-containing protein n=1 Tax=Gluconacetobacter johannae TaxID=112140 RepID=A0A7W4J6N1_9PROT|nr:hypothetical protein [Gluconacetobacter johannae]MBB2175478.1 hypothetical protein [Gluconacetobacter johannae]GBQ89034.1 hypothetical protein AA13595_2542 [Gluconacetobacter johannae DSM 13595]
MAARAATSDRAAFGLLVPVGPPDYKMIFDQLQDDHVQTFGPFTYHAGRIHGVPVVVSVAPMDGPLMRSLAAQEMLHHYRIGAFLYPGTSGAHLGPEAMRIGDIVLGAANVNFGNFFMSKSGDLVGNEFGHEKSSPTHYDGLYLDPSLLGRLACAAHRVATHTTLPGWLNPHQPRTTPDIFYYGVQGTSTMWLANTDFIEKTNRIFHVIDEDGDWYSNLVATIYHVPFIEVSTISNSIFALPETDRGIPQPPDGKGPKANVTAQRISNAVILDLIAHDGLAILAEQHATPTVSPYPAGVFQDPKRHDALFAAGKCM